MKLTIDIGEDEQLRKEILLLVATQIKKLTGDEIKKMVREQLSQIDMSSKVVSAIKDYIKEKAPSIKDVIGLIKKYK